MDVLLPVPLRKIFRRTRIMDPKKAQTERGRQYVLWAISRGLAYITNDASVLSYAPELVGLAPKGVTPAYDSLIGILLLKVKALHGELSLEETRKRLQLINFEDYMSPLKVKEEFINFAAPELHRYAGHNTIEVERRDGKIIRLATLTAPATDGTRELRRAGVQYYEGVGNTPIQEKIIAVASKLYGGAGICFDRIQSGHFGLAAGILPAATRPRHLGVILGEIFKDSFKAEDLYSNVDTGIYVDKIGTIVDFYGWPFSSTELTSPILLDKLVRLLANPNYFDAHLRGLELLYSYFREDVPGADDSEFVGFLQGELTQV